MPRLDICRITRPCGCTTPILAIFTGAQSDKIVLHPHSHRVNQNCWEHKQGFSCLHGWLTVNAWIRKYTHNRNRRVIKSDLAQQQVKLLAQSNRIVDIE